MANNPIPRLEPIKVLASIIQVELGLEAKQVLLSFENFPIPETLGLFVALAYGVEEVVGASDQNGLDLEGNFTEVQSVAMLHHVEIDIMSFDSSARLRKEEVVMALNSYNAQESMEVNSMRIAAITTSFNTIQSLEPSKQLNRYRFTVSVYALHQKVLLTPFYDSISPVELVENP